MMLPRFLMYVDQVHKLVVEVWRRLYRVSLVRDEELRMLTCDCEHCTVASTIIMRVAILCSIQSRHLKVQRNRLKIVINC
jgi:hypothetical protein